MDIEKNWDIICKIVETTTKGGFCSFATINKDGASNVTPIGSLFMGDKCNLNL